MQIAELSLRRPVSTVMFFVSLMVIGAIAAVRLPLEFFPAVDAPFIFVNIPYPSSTPAEIERTITRPVEEALSTLTGVKRLNSSSRADNAQFFMEFDWGEDVAIKASDVRSRIDAIRDELPTDLQRYFVNKFSTSDAPILAVRLASERNLGDSYELIDRKIKRPLERLPGIARAEINGISPPELEIELDSDRLTAHGINLNELARTLAALNFSVSAGLINDGTRRFRVQPIGEFRDLDEIRALVIGPNGIRLSDIATVTLQPGEVFVRRHLDFKPAVGIDVFKERNANLVDAGRRAYAAIEEMQKDPALGGIEIYVLEHQAEGVVSSLKSLAEAGFIGTVLSIVVLFFFLRHWPSTLMISLAVPVCFVITLGIMYFVGLSLNILSMMGLLLGVGMVVDNAVVAVESIYQQREKFPDDPPKASIVGVRNVAIALSAGTICHCIVFLPNIFGELNQISIFLSHVAIAITISLLASWLFAVSLTPLLSARIPAPTFVNRDSLVQRMKERYAATVRWALAHRGKTMLATGVLLAVSVYPMQQVKFDMFDSAGARRIELQIELNGVYTLDEMERAVRPLEEWLYARKQEFELQSVYLWLTEQFGGGFRLMLIEDGAEKSTEQIMEEIRKGLPKIAIGTVNFGEQRRGGGGEGLRVAIVGDSSTQLRELGNVVVPILRAVEGLRDVRTDEASATREIAVRVDRERAAQYGFTANDIATYIAIALRGAPLKEFRAAEDEVPVWLRFQNSDSASVEDLRDFKLRAPTGEQIPLMSLVDVRVQDSASAIQRENRQTAFPIKINLADGVTQDDARKRIEEALNPIAFPAGYRWTFGGAFDEEDEAGQQMAFNTLIALVMIYVVMAALFESLIFPAAILTTIVFSIFGVFWFFWLTGTVFSIMASIGILILMGVVVNNGIVMVEHINQLRHAGLSRTEALVQGSRDRLRPVLMTMGCTILGMTPLCLGSTQIGGDGPPYYPMARAIVGGLIFSTFITLLVLPTIYAILDDWRNGARRLVRRARGLPETEPPLPHPAPA
jgi:HAE1 family hydrophobic/amphiphilic exporter-1